MPAAFIAFGAQTRQKASFRKDGDLGMFDEKPASKRSHFRVGRLTVGVVAAAVLCCVLILVLMPRLGVSSHAARSPIAAPTKVISAVEALATMVAQELTAPRVKPKTAVLPFDQALDVTAAIKRGDYAAAQRIADEVLARSKPQSWRFYPFNNFINSIARSGNDPSLLEHLNEWLQHEPKSAIAHLIRAVYYRHAAWARAAKTSPAKSPTTR